MTLGCVIHGPEWVELEPRNAAVRGMTRLFGPMPGSYDGPYPIEAQVNAALVSGSVISVQELWNDRVDLPDGVLTLAPGIGQGLLKETDWAASINCPGASDGLARNLGPVKGALYAGRCILLSIPRSDPSGRVSGAQVCFVLIDARNGRPFAYYPEAYSLARRLPTYWTD